MKNEDIKVLSFRKELKDLLNKYNYDISGTVFDDGSMNIEDKSSGSSYVIEDEYNNYEILKSNTEGKYDNLMEQYILNCFTNDELNFDNSKARIGIITSNEEKADKIFEEIFNSNKGNIKRYIDSKNQKEILFEDNITHYVWVRPSNSARGCRFKGAYIDKDINIEIFENVIIPICAFCKKDNIKVI